MPGVGRLLPGWRGELIPDGSGHPASVRGSPAADGLHPHRAVPHAPAGGPAVAHALQRHGQHAHDQQEPPLGSGQAHGQSAGRGRRSSLAEKKLTGVFPSRCFLP